MSTSNGSKRRPRIGLVLGAGGVQGGSWLVGGLDALAAETGWDPATADVIVGTSAGSMIGALCGAGVPPWFMVAHSRGETFEGIFDAGGEPAASSDRSGGARYHLHRGLPRIGPGSPGLALRSLLSPTRHTPATALSAWLPRGAVSTDPLAEQVRRVVPEGWAAHPNLWIVACDYETGRRTVFGRQGAPRAELAEAVAASCAVPGFYRPVEIGDSSYVDGGVCSPSNLDVVVDEPLDLVVCLNPTSTLHPIRALNPASVAQLLFHRPNGRRLGSEAKKVHAAGIETVLIQPLREDLETMSMNLMSRRNRNRVIDVARRTVAEQLRDPQVADLLARLPSAGEPERVRRPSGPPSDWPALADLQQAA